MTEPTQFVTLVYFDEAEAKDDVQMRAFGHFRDQFQQKWGHLLNEHGQWWGREIAKRQRLWWICFFKDEHSNGIMQKHPDYEAHKAEFYRTVAPAKTRLVNVPVRGSLPLYEVLQAGFTLTSCFRFAHPQDSANCDKVSQRITEEFDFEGWRGGAYIPAVESNNESVFLGAWDNVEASEQLGADGRQSDLLLEVNNVWESAEYTFLAHVEFQKHIMNA